MTKLDKDKFKDLFNTWWPKIEKFFDSGGFDPIYEQLKAESKRGYSIAPLSQNTFRVFQETDINEVKVAFFGICPYHSFINNTTPVADGLCMSCSVTGKLQPSLIKFYDSLERELNNGMCLSCVKNPDLSYLAKQGVFLGNMAFTTTKNKAGNHVSLWQPFIQFLFEEILNDMGVPIVLMGKETHRLEKYTAPFSWVFKVSHPASAAYMGEDAEWDSENIFKNINKILWERNKFVINWFDSNEIPF